MGGRPGLGPRLWCCGPQGGVSLLGLLGHRFPSGLSPVGSGTHCVCRGGCISINFKKEKKKATPRKMIFGEQILHPKTKQVSYCC